MRPAPARAAMMPRIAKLVSMLEGPVQALDGIRVVDFTSGVAGPHCTKLLADFGAEVIKVEPAEGDEARRLPPFAGDVPDQERSLMFLHLNTNKRSVTLNPESADGLRLLRRLIGTAQVVVEDFEPGVAAERGLGYEELSADRPDLAYASITPWGQDGPYVEMGLRASDIVLQGMGGPVSATGSAEREPIKLGGQLAMMQAGIVAAFGILSVVLRVEAGGAGDHIDVSIYETQAGSRDRRTVALTAHAYMGSIAGRSRPGMSLGSGVRPCQDGFINLTAMGPKVDSFVTMIGREDLVGDPRLLQPPTTLDPAFVEEIDIAYLGWSMARTRQEALAEAQSNGILSGAVNTPEDLVTDQSYRERGMWDEIKHPVAGTFDYPGRPLIMSETPRAEPRRAPLLGEHNAQVLTELLDVPAAELPLLRGVGAI